MSCARCCQTNTPPRLFIKNDFLYLFLLSPLFGGNSPMRLGQQGDIILREHLVIYLKLWPLHQHRVRGYSVLHGEERRVPELSHPAQVCQGGDPRRSRPLFIRVKTSLVEILLLAYNVPMTNLL